MIQFIEETVDAYDARLGRWFDGGAKLRCSFLHHTATDSRHFAGKATMESYRSCHISHGGGSDIFCHLYATPDGTVFPARPVTVWNCACQAPGRPWGDLPVKLRVLINNTRGSLPWKSWPNAYGFSVETVGNFDYEDPITSRSMRTSLDALACVHRRWQIPVEHCFFHRDVEQKSCPGAKVTLEWVHDQLRARLGETRPSKEEPLVVLLPGWERNCRALLIDGELWVDVDDIRRVVASYPIDLARGMTRLRTVAEVEKLEIILTHWATQGKVYLRRIGGG